MDEKELTAEVEYEGDARSTWWYVCGECNGAVDYQSRYCTVCGRRLIWGRALDAKARTDEK